MLEQAPLSGVVAASLTLLQQHRRAHIETTVPTVLQPPRCPSFARVAAAQRPLPLN